MVMVVVVMVVVVVVMVVVVVVVMVMVVVTIGDRDLGLHSRLTWGVMPRLEGEAKDSALLSSRTCSGGLRPLVELCVEPAGLCGRCTGVAVPLRVVPSATGVPSKRGPGQSSIRVARESWGLRSSHCRVLLDRG